MQLTGNEGRVEYHKQFHAQAAGKAVSGLRVRCFSDTCVSLEGQQFLGPDSVTPFVSFETLTWFVSSRHFDPTDGCELWWPLGSDLFSSRMLLWRELYSGHHGASTLRRNREKCTYMQRKYRSHFLIYFEPGNPVNEIVLSMLWSIFGVSRLF